MTSPANHEAKARHVKLTWGKRCDRQGTIVVIVIFIVIVMFVVIFIKFIVVVIIIVMLIFNLIGLFFVMFMFIFMFVIIVIVSRSISPRLLFMSSVQDEDLPAVALNVTEDWEVIWGKTKKAFSYVYRNHYEEADWFLKADDDTYVIVENLRLLLATKNSSEPQFFGHKFKQHVKQVEKELLPA